VAPNCVFLWIHIRKYKKNILKVDLGLAKGKLETPLANRWVHTHRLGGVQLGRDFVALGLVLSMGQDLGGLVLALGLGDLASALEIVFPS
jgi:hypothetical protein